MPTIAVTLPRAPGACARDVWAGGAPADRLTLYASTVTRQGAQLDGDGPLRKRPDHEDDRSFLISATRREIDAARGVS
jgi:hypothetical protein